MPIKSQFKNKQNAVERKESEHWAQTLLGDRRMISYELRRGEERLERKNRREMVSRVRCSLTREGEG